MNLGTYSKNAIGEDLVNIPHTTPLMKFDPLTFGLWANTFTIKPPHLL
jgi:hypothetical protein